MKVYTGPTKVLCPLRCDVPSGVRLTIVPPSRHNWGDVIRCPNERADCVRTFLVEHGKKKIKEEDNGASQG